MSFVFSKHLFGDGLIELTLVLGWLIIIGISSFQWLHGKQACPLRYHLEVTVFPNERHSSLSDGDHHYVHERLMVQGVHASSLCDVESQFFVNLVQVLHVESRGLKIIGWNMNVLQIPWFSTCAKWNLLNLIVQRKSWQKTLVIVKLQCFALDGFSQDSEDVIADLVLLSHGIDNPVIKAFVHLS